MPTFESIVAWALEPRMSCAHNRWSKDTDSPKLNISSAGAELNRPPQVTCFFFLTDMMYYQCPTLSANQARTLT